MRAKGKSVVDNCIAYLLVSAAVFLMTACDEVGEPMASRIPVVAMEVQRQNFDVYSELAGEVRGSKVVNLRARVSGVLVEKHFADGVLVNEGDVLFSIDDRDSQERVNESRGALATAESNLARATLDVERYAPLLKDKAISKQIYDNAVATEKAARSQLESAKAALKQAQLNVTYAQITAPVTGRIGEAFVNVGDLINPGNTLLATISNTDPAWVDFSVSESALLAYERQHGVVAAAGDPESPLPGGIRLFLSDGSAYPFLGKLIFTDRALDPSTGTYQLRAEFTNPSGLLRPGMFARVRLTTETLNNAILIPDKAVTQILDQYFVTVVGENNQAVRKPVQLGVRQSGMWEVKAGLRSGELIVVEGIQKARPGAPLEVSKQAVGTKKNNKTAIEVMPNPGKGE